MIAESLYVHFPFCLAKCHYCDFYSIPCEGPRFQEERERYFSALAQEAASYRGRVSPSLKTVYFGGGTPSLLPAERAAAALEPLLGAGALEWTLEANPSSLDKGRLNEWRSIGVNRMSLGIQSLDDHLLRWLGRIHSRQGALDALDLIFAAGFTNVSVDLICGVPGQTKGRLRADIEDLFRFPITHLSCYLLTLPPDHRLFGQLPDEETQQDHYLWIDRLLAEQGFRHYEISNFARPGFESRHNLNYWRGGSYLALGPSAHSFSREGGTRWKNVSSLTDYSARLTQGQPAVEWTESLTDEQRAIERWMLALRLDDGFPVAWLDSPVRRRRADLLLEKGLLQSHPADSERLRATAVGWAVCDQITTAFL